MRITCFGTQQVRDTSPIPHPIKKKKRQTEVCKPFLFSGSGSRCRRGSQALTMCGCSCPAPLALPIRPLPSEGPHHCPVAGLPSKPQLTGSTPHSTHASKAPGVTQAGSRRRREAGPAGLRPLTRARLGRRRKSRRSSPPPTEFRGRLDDRGRCGCTEVPAEALRRRTLEPRA